MNTKAQRQVDQWNAQYPIGTAVELTKDDGTVIPTTTRSQAQLLGGHSAVIWLEHITGCYALRCVAIKK